MCQIKKEKTTHANGRSETKKILFLCNNSVDGRPCDDVRTKPITERVPGTSSQLALRPSSSRRDEVVLHQDTSRHRPEPRQERRYSTQLGVRIHNWRPVFSLQRLDDEGSRSHRRRGDSESRSTSGEVLPEAPMPPLPPPLVHQSGRRSPPPSAMPTLMPSPNRPTPPQGPGAAAAYTTRDTVPSSSGAPSRTSSTRSRDAHRAVQDLLPLTVPASGPSVTSSRHARSTPGLSRLRVESRPMFHDSAYGGSSNISPIDAPPKTDTFSETYSNPTSERTASVRYNYTNETAVVGREDHDTDDEDQKSNSSKGRKRYHIIRRVRTNDDPEMTQRKMQEDIRAAEEHQSQTSEQGDGAVRSGSGSRRRRHHRR
ncbi:hypothetical protein KCU64_g6769, partial [Aureobasidium melanogenum]